MLAVYLFYIYYILVAIVGFLIGLLFFKLLNEKFDVYYFGFAGVVSTFGGCWFAGTVITYLLGWLAIIVGIIAFLVNLIKGNKKTDSA